MKKSPREREREYVCVKWNRKASLCSSLITSTKVTSGASRCFIALPLSRLPTGGLASCPDGASNGANNTLSNSDMGNSEASDQGEFSR